MTNKIKELRERLGLSINRLGEISGIGAPNLSRIENGKRPITLEHAKNLSKHLHCAPTDLLPKEFSSAINKKIDLELIEKIDRYLRLRHKNNELKTLVRIYNSTASRNLSDDQLEAVIDVTLDSSF